MKKNIRIILILFSVIFLVVAGGLFLPEIFLKYSAEKLSGQIQTVPSQYYLSAGSAVSKVASLQLSEYEKIRLISNAWDSETNIVESEETDKQAFEIVEMAKKNLQTLYNKDLYPISFSKIGPSWFSWEAQCYRSTDATFHTYSAYYWLIKLTRYDNKETHIILMTEEGNILYAEVTGPKNEKHIVDITVNYKKLPMLNNSLVSCTRFNPNTTKLPTYPDIKFPTYKECVGVLTVGNEWIRDEETLKKYYEMSPEALEFYYVFQAGESTGSIDHYIIGIIPYEGEIE